MSKDVVREPCGCEGSERNPQTLTWNRIAYCPMHKAAPTMFIFLRSYLTTYPVDEYSDKCAALLAKIDGAGA